MALRDGGVNTWHSGADALDTANWRDSDGPGNLRVSYVLPSSDWTVAGAGVMWSDLAGEGEEPLLRHGLVWVDLQ